MTNYAKFAARKYRAFLIDPEKRSITEVPCTFTRHEIKITFEGKVFVVTPDAG